MTDVRPAGVAGSWYSSAPDRLASEVDAYIARATVDASVRAPKAIIAPHAGLKYSGPVAAFAYKAAAQRPYRIAVLVGPSHFVAFQGVSLWPRGAWQTPFGDVPVARELAEAIQGASSDIVEHPAAHGREHSLEMQLPFLAHLLPGISIVPMVMGDQRRDTAFHLGDALAHAIGPREDVLLVASSDLSHYQSAVVAEEMDAVVMERVERVDPDGLMLALEQEPHHACGGGPMVAVLHATRQLGAAHARVLKYGDSGDVSGDKSSVVGYMAAAVW